MTKYLTREKVDHAIDKMGQVVQEGRANSSLDIQGTAKVLRENERQDNRAGEEQWEAHRDGGARASSTEVDHWEIKGNQVARVHMQPRQSLFTVADEDEGLPRQQREMLGPIRTTRGKDLTGVEFVLHP